MILLQLLWSFTKIGFTSFGGISMIPLILDEMSSHGWMTASEISDIVAIAEMTPGPLGLNCATFAGIRVAGILGAIAANLGVLMPTFTICAAAAFVFEKFHNNPILKKIMVGVRPVGLGLVTAVIVNLILTNYYTDGSLEWICIAIGTLACVLLIKFKVSIPKIIGIAAVLGIIFLR